jgi:cell division septal protein FtsQ
MQTITSRGVSRATVELLDDRGQRHATARAQAAAIVDSPRHGRRFDPTRDRRLRRSPRRRLHAKGPARVKPRVRWTRARRLLAFGALIVQLALLGVALRLPAFQVHSVSVTGTGLLTPQEVIDAAAVPQQSIFVIDANAIRQRLLAMPWIQAATVSTELPATVRIAVVERPPALRVRRDGADVYVADNGATAAASLALETRWASAPVLLDDRAGSTQPLAPQLVQDLALVAQRFPSIFGCSVAAFQWGVDDAVSIWTDKGWRAIVGHLDTQDDLSALPAQLEALAGLRGQLNFLNPNFGYVDLENPATPAIGGHPGLPAEVIAAATPPDASVSAASGPNTAGVPLPSPTPKPSPSPSPDASASPGASPSPSSSPSPSASPAPTPANFTIVEPAPSPSGH